MIKKNKKQGALNSPSLSGWGSFTFHPEFSVWNQAWRTEAKSSLSACPASSPDPLRNSRALLPVSVPVSPGAAFLAIGLDDMSQMPHCHYHLTLIFFFSAQSVQLSNKMTGDYTGYCLPKSPVGPVVYSFPLVSKMWPSELPWVLIF